MNNQLRGAFFFSRFLPSFSRIGYNSRRIFWRDSPLDFSGQRWLVTGATDGIGREIARQAAAAGAQVHAVGRDPGKLDALRQLPGDWVTHAQDLSLMYRISAFADQVATAPRHFDVLVNNVGLMLNKRTLTEEQLETSFATNLLGHFVLTEHLRKSGVLNDSLILNMTSGGMYNVPLNLERLQGSDQFDGMLTYAYQKRAQVVLSEWWRRQGEASYVMHPGWVDTAGVRTAMPDFHRLTGPLLRDLNAGADTALWLAMQKPTQPEQSKVWFDRAPRSPHIFADTRAGADADALVDYLTVQAANAQQARAA